MFDFTSRLLVSLLSFGTLFSGSGTPVAVLPDQPVAVVQSVDLARASYRPVTQSQPEVQSQRPHLYTFVWYRRPTVSQAPKASAPAPAQIVKPVAQAPRPVTQTPQPVTPVAAPGLTAEESRMVDLVNAERARAGLPVLQVDPGLVQTARAKSQNMATLHYFGHESPTLGSPFDQMRAAGIRYTTAGENIAGNQSVDAAHQALMNSPGHRANILNPSFTKVGIGIIHGGQYGMMFTQQFIG